MRRWLASLAAIAAIATGSITATSAEALPLAPEPVRPVTGIPTPCPSVYPFPEGESIETIKDRITATFGFKLSGSQWTKASMPSIKILWETLDAVECTTYRADLLGKQKGNVGLNASRIRGFAWGDWSLTKVGYVSLDFTKFQRALDSGDEGRIVRLVIHELAHVLNSDRYENPGYWKAFKKLYAKEGRFSDYAGRSVTETFADVVGYYVGRCALDNPYDTGKHDAYYAFARDNIFGGKEFGPAPGETPDCSLPADGAEEPMPGAADTPDWIEGLSGE